MKRLTAILVVFVMLAGLCCCSSNKAKGRVSEDNGIKSSIDVEVGN